MISSVYEVSKEFMKNPQWVEIDYEQVYKIANAMISTGVSQFPRIPEKDRKDRSIISQELVASSINYCYWYGKSTIRPNNSSSTKMYELVEQSFSNYDPFSADTSFKACVSRLTKRLATNRFPLLEERVKHLTEVAMVGEHIVQEIHRGFINNQCKPETDGYRFVQPMIELLPGFASDIFLKRLSLFFLQLYRKLGYYESMMEYLPVPADYQVPKMLKHFGCISYHPVLDAMVQNNDHISKGSLKECEIRAATVIVCQELQKETGWNISDIDSWLWLRRKECNDPFHLTITTDY